LNEKSRITPEPRGLTPQEDGEARWEQGGPACGHARHGTGARRRRTAGVGVRIYRRMGLGLSITGPSRSLIASTVLGLPGAAGWGTALIVGIPLGTWLSARGSITWRAPGWGEVGRRFAGGMLMGDRRDARGGLQHRQRVDRPLGARDEQPDRADSGLGRSTSSALRWSGRPDAPRGLSPPGPCASTRTSLGSVRHTRRLVGQVRALLDNLTADALALGRTTGRTRSA
jgi:hypothetical protein